MKLVTALIRPDKADQIRSALEAYGVPGLTISPASGYGRQRGHTQTYRGASHTVDLLPKVRLEVLVDDLYCQDILDVLVSTANTGSAGDGKIWVTKVDEVIRVRTGERGMAAV